MLTRSHLCGILLALLGSGPLFSQQPCKRSSPVFQFDPDARPRLFTEKLGNHPQFPFLQYEKGIVTRALFLKAAKDPESRRQYATGFAVFNHLLQDIGFTHGYKDLRLSHISNGFINPGSIGNLGFFNKESNYIYVKLNPSGEGDDGVAAWKITGPGGCYIYILHTCGNAFFIDDPAMGNTTPCPCDPTPRPKTDTTTTHTDTVYITKHDTLRVRTNGAGKDTLCHKKWEITLDGGASFNAIPRFDNTTQHSRTNGAQPAAEITVSRICNRWLQLGLSAAYLPLSYQDDIPYPASTPNTYNTVYPGNPLIPVQVFGKATIGGPLGWQANVSLSLGYSFVAGDKIVDNGTTLATKPGTKGGPTAGFKLGIAYFFSCRWGLGLSFDGQYFNNNAAIQHYSLIALPIMAGIRYRW